MTATQDRGRVARGWASASNLGSTPLGGPRNRTIISANQFAMVGAGLHLLLLALFASYRAPALWPAGAMVLGVIGCFGLVLFLNHVGWNLVASLVALAAPAASFTYLAYVFSADSGFHLYLLGGGALGFALYRTDQWAARAVMIPACGIAAIVAQMRWDAAQPRVDVPLGFVTALYAVNVALVVVLFYVLARFNHRYYVRERDRNAQLLESAQVAAQTDALTDVFNRRGVAPILSSVARRGEYSLALVDLDRFKRINDRLGHGAGDVVLANAARTLVRSVGDAGTVARWGGEEFLVIIPGLSLVEADELMERVRAEVEDEYGAPESLARVTISVGLAHAPRYAGKEEVLRLADANLYEAKSAGRNVVISARLTDENA